MKNCYNALHVWFNWYILMQSLGCIKAERAGAWLAGASVFKLSDFSSYPWRYCGCGFHWSQSGISSQTVFFLIFRITIGIRLFLGLCHSAESTLQPKVPIRETCEARVERSIKELKVPVKPTNKFEGSSNLFFLFPVQFLRLHVSFPLGLCF